MGFSIAFYVVHFSGFPTLLDKNTQHTHTHNTDKYDCRIGAVIELDVCVCVCVRVRERERVCVFWGQFNISLGLSLGSCSSSL